MTTPYQWHQNQLSQAMSLDPDLMPAAIADPENGVKFMTAYLLVISDGLRSLQALCLSASAPVVLIGKEDSGASS